MTDKVELLNHICENPGWSPPGASTLRSIEMLQLVDEGWIAPRLDGYEATPKAMECYPHFRLGENGEVVGLAHLARIPERAEPELPEQVIDLSKAAVWCDYCKAMVKLVRRGPDALAPDALGCMGCARAIGHANFWK